MSLSCPYSTNLKDLIMDSSSNLVNACIIVSLTVFISYICYHLFHKVLDLIWYISTKSVDITGPFQDGCGLYHHLLLWLQTNAELHKFPHINITSESHREDDGRITTKLNTQPNYETKHYFNYNGHWVFVQRIRLNVVMYDTPYESIRLTTFRIHSNILSELLEEVRQLFNIESEDADKKTRFFFANEGYWSECGNGKRKRPLSSVILNDTILKKIHGDVKEFLTSVSWYQDRGIPYRRGYLLYGPPGCGKSSFVKAIAGEIDHDICILSLSSKNLNDDTLNSLMNSTSENCIILLEDIDAAFPNREDDNNEDNNETKSGHGHGHNKKSIENSENGTGKVTLRGLLNALDGVASTEGRIVFLTTNYIDRLDPAMTRPGRVDLKVFIDLPDDDQLGRMFIRFYPDAIEEDKTEFIKKIRGLKDGAKISMAMIQGLFMLHKHDFKEMMENIGNYFEDQFFSLKK